MKTSYGRSVRDIFAWHQTVEEGSIGGTFTNGNSSFRRGSCGAFFSYVTYINKIAGIVLINIGGNIFSNLV